MLHPNLYTLGTPAFRHSRHPRQSCQTRAGDFLRYASWMARHTLVRFCSVGYLHSFEMCSHDLVGSATLPLGMCGSTSHKIPKASSITARPCAAGLGSGSTGILRFIKE